VTCFCEHDDESFGTIKARSIFTSQSSNKVGMVYALECTHHVGCCTDVI
jgi:hypothetical protein